MGIKDKYSGVITLGEKKTGTAMKRLNTVEGHSRRAEAEVSSKKEARRPW